MESEIKLLLNRLQRVAPGLLLATAVFAVFSNTFTVPFLLDDIPTIPGNASLRSLSPLSDVLFPPPEIYSAGRPLLNLSFALNYAIGETAVGGYHAVNLAIHLAAAFAAYGLIRRLLACAALGGHTPESTRWIALAVATLWAVHPLQTVSVTYISQRAESLMGLFFLLTVYCFLRGVTGGATTWRPAAVVACAAGMLTKEVMVTAPVVVLLIDWQVVSGSLAEVWRRRWKFYLALAATWLPLAGLMVMSNLARRAVGLGQGMSSLDYARIECVAVVRYLRLALWPEGLVFDYGPSLAPPGIGAVLLCAGALAAMVAIALAGLRRRAPWALPLAVFFVLLAPTSSIVPIAGQPIAENRLYLPLLALIAAAALGLRTRLAKAGPWLLGAAALTGGVFAHARNADYRSAISIWTDTVAKRPDNPRAAVYLAQAHRDAGNPTAAAEVLLAALPRQTPTAELHNNIAASLVVIGRNADAAVHFETALRLNPNLAITHENYGAWLFASGKPAAALEALRRALAINPTSVGAHYFAGHCLLQLGDLPAAAAEFEATLHLDPTHAAARANLAALQMQTKNSRR